MVKALILSIAILSLTGCVTTGGSFCDLAKPMRPSQATIEAMSDAEVEAMLLHNRTLETQCGVKP